MAFTPRQQLLQSCAIAHAVIASKKTTAKGGQRRCAKKAGSRKGRFTTRRKRRSVRDVHNELGRNLFRRAYRMHIETLFDLYQAIKSNLFLVLKYKTDRKSAPNGRIHPSVRLASALRIFAGGEAPDICSTFGISKTVVHDSVSQVTEAVNMTENLAIKFPSDHTEQKAIAQGFKEKSTIGLDTCVSPVDGMLIWMHKPWDAECKQAGVGSKKFFCGRKKKFGLNMQGSCDHLYRFTNISIRFPAATSDFLAFEASPFRQLLETSGFLAEGLCLFGDNAYVNKSYMATPYTNVPAGDSRDSYNFFHSQLRITIECAFGILVSRWGLLRKPMPAKFTIKKIVSIVECLCRLHNFLINVKKENNVVPAHTAQDELNLALDGAIPMPFRQLEELNGESIVLPDQILHGGHHFDDDPNQEARRSCTENSARAQSGGSVSLPREIMYNKVKDGDFRRPTARSY